MAAGVETVEVDAEEIDISVVLSSAAVEVTGDKADEVGEDGYVSEVTDSVAGMDVSEMESEVDTEVKLVKVDGADEDDESEVTGAVLLVKVGVDTEFDNVVTVAVVDETDVDDVSAVVGVVE